MPTWLLDGSLLLLPGALVDPATGKLTPLPTEACYAPGEDGRVASLDVWGPPRVRVLQRGEERWSVVLPEAPAEDARVVLALRGDTVFVHAASVNTGEATCWRVTAAGAERPERCLEASFAVLDALAPAGPDTWVVASHGEGHPAVDLVRWSGGATEALPVPWRDLYPYGGLWMQLRPDGSFDVVTTCELGPEQPCLETTEEVATTFRRYRWKPGDTPRLVGVDAGAPRSPDPTSERVAWTKGDEVCVDGPKQRRRCFPAR